ncbi:MAG: hypothetical protein ABIK36_16305 [Pseudomonadota bacterium]
MAKPITPNTRPRVDGDVWDGIVWRLQDSFGIEVSRPMAAQFAWRVLKMHGGYERSKPSDYRKLLHELFGVEVERSDAFEFCDEVYLDVTPPQSDELFERFGDPRVER